MIEKISQYSLFLVISVVMSCLVMTNRASAQDNSPIQVIAVLQAKLEELTERVDTLEAQLACVSTASDSGNLYFDGCNVHVRNGGGQTNVVNSKGNLIIGYNQDRVPDTDSDKRGSHNLIIGDQHNYTSYGGLVVGWRNTIAGVASSVTAGQNNIASGDVSHISGGERNTTSGQLSSVSGGRDNTASGVLSNVSGGFGNEASGLVSSVSGGNENTASGQLSSVSGGRDNTASGNNSSVSGGFSRSAVGNEDWAAGSLHEDH